MKIENVADLQILVHTARGGTLTAAAARALGITPAAASAMLKRLETQCEIAYHLQNESNDATGRPTLSRTLSDYCTPEQEQRLTDCYTASAAFSAAARDATELPALADAARLACLPVPAKRYYQAYDALLKGIRYVPD